MYGYSAGYGGEVSEVKLESLYERLKPILDRTDKYHAFPGKAIPYFGQWSNMDFNGKVMIGLHDDGSVGILPTNIWGMQYRSLTDSELASMVYKLNGLINHLNREDLAIFYKWVQALDNDEQWMRVK